MKVTHKSNTEGSGMIAMVILSLLLVVGQADAALITYNFSGAISDLRVPLFTFSGTGSTGFSTGLIFTSSYTYDPATPPIVPRTGLYSPVLSNLSLRIGNYSASLGLTGSVFSSNALSTDAPSLSSFATNRWRLVFASGQMVQGSLTSLQAFPLPASVFLFGVALVALVGLGAGGFQRIHGVHT